MTEEEYRYQMWKQAKRFVDLIEKALAEPEAQRPAPGSTPLFPPDTEMP